MAGGYVDLYSVQLSSEKLTLNRINAEELLSNLVFVGMQDRIDSDPSLIKKINGVFVYNITKNGKPVATWSKLTFLLFRMNKIMSTYFFLYLREISL